MYSNNASCDEIPDAIGWSSVYGWEGSTVIECKTSVSDFYADKRKHFVWEQQGTSPWRYSMDRLTKKQAAERGFLLVPVAMMGDYRFYLCEPGILSVDLVAEHMPDHGLIYRVGRSMKVIRQAKKRELVDKDGEIRYLRFAIINSKKPYERIVDTPTPQLFDAKQHPAPTV